MVVAALVVGHPTRGHADDLADARHYAAALDYDRALAIVDAALQRGDNDPPRVVELHLLAGELAAGLDHPDVAQDHFARALALRSDAALPVGSSPKLTAPFDAARSRVIPTLRVRAELVPGLARVVVDADPLGLVIGVAVDVVDVVGTHDELVARGATRIAIPAGSTAVEIAALDGDGNRLWISPLDRAPTPAAPNTRGTRAWWARWPGWAIAGAAAAVAGGLFGWRTEVAQDEYDQLRRADGAHDYSEVTAVESRGRDLAIAADVGFGVAIAAGVTALVLALHHHDDHRATLAVTARDGQLAVGVGAHF